MFCRVSRSGEPIESSGATGAAEALASLAWKGLLKRASDRQRSVVRRLVRARIAHESLDQLEQRRALGWASSHEPAPILIGQHRQVLHCLHVSPTHQRLLRKWNADLFSRARFGLEQTATIVCQLPRASHRVRAKGQARDKSQTDPRQSVSHPQNWRAVVGRALRPRAMPVHYGWSFRHQHGDLRARLRVSRQRLLGPDAWMVVRFDPVTFGDLQRLCARCKYPGLCRWDLRQTPTIRFGKNSAATGRRWVVSGYCAGEPELLSSEPPARRSTLAHLNVAALRPSVAQLSVSPRDRRRVLPPPILA
jgi:hypothetical protein